MSNYPRDDEFKCGQCGATFFTREELRRHEETHPNAQAGGMRFQPGDEGAERSQMSEGYPWRVPQHEHTGITSGDSGTQHGERGMADAARNPEHKPASVQTGDSGARMPEMGEERSGRDGERERMQPAGNGSQAAKGVPEPKSEEPARSHAGPEPGSNGSQKGRAKRKPKK